jgi:hypothetical protein
MKRSAKILGFAMVLASFAGVSFALDEKKQGTIRYISGGIGDDEKDELASRAKDYNLKIMTAQRKTGIFLSDCRVVLRRSEAVVLDTVMEGPQLLARLEAGNYRAAVSCEGKEQQRPFAIGPRGQASLFLYWD